MEKPRYIDIHAHTNFTVFDADRAEVVQRALDAGVWMINIGTQQQTSKKAVEMTREFPVGVYSIVGLHPVHVNPSYHDVEELGEGGKSFTSRGEDFDINYYRSLIAEDRASAAKEGRRSKIVGIGECGLDFYRMPTEAERTRQIEAFRGQIELALECDLPLMLHVRQAYGEVLGILTEYREKLASGHFKGWGPERLRGDCHFFAGTVDDARGFLAIGFHISFTGVATFAKQYKELIEAAPLDRIMSETDCPYVAPVPERGKRNEPSFVIHIADKIADIKASQGVADANSIKKQLVENAFALFKLG
ncbi:MAG TPA: TatD family hydrolase [Candidatus Paceibacterota bacterium]